jgi:hypothetical protein
MRRRVLSAIFCLPVAAITRNRLRPESAVFSDGKRVVFSAWEETEISPSLEIEWTDFSVEDERQVDPEG